MTNERGVSKKPAFLAAFVTTASVTKAAAAADIERTLHYRWLEEDSEYAAAFAKAKLEAGEALEDEAIRRAHEGFLEPVIYQGQLCYDVSQYETDKRGKPTKLKADAKPITTRKYSDALLMKLLDGFLPEKYKRRAGVELTGKDGGPIKLENESLKKLSDEELASLIEVAKKLKADE